MFPSNDLFNTFEPRLEGVEKIVGGKHPFKTVNGPLTPGLEKPQLQLGPGTSETRMYQSDPGVTVAGMSQL